MKGFLHRRASTRSCTTASLKSWQAEKGQTQADCRKAVHREGSPAEGAGEEKSMKNNITLTGMPGAGKSTLGVVLAKVLGYEFLDSDLLIQKREGKKLSKIIEKEGTEGFKRIEDQVNASIEAEHTVIATGGSVVYCQNAMEHLKEISTVVYLELSLPELEKRLRNLRGRGVVFEEGQTLEDLYRERLPLYEKYADIVIRETGKDMEETLQAVLDALAVREKDYE